MSPSPRTAVCVDVGSTFTKAAAVDLDSGALLATAAHDTTVDSDVLRGLDAAVTALNLTGPPTTVDVCSSAGGGLRLAVVGYERLVTAQAGERVGLSAGARVVHVAAGPLDRAAAGEIRHARPDIILLVGGTDGGDVDILRHNASALARSGPRVPVVVAGNSEVRDEAMALLGARAVGAENVLPRIGELNPTSARAAIREVFLGHVIGGKRLSKGPRFPRLVRGATPDVVLTGVELLAEVVGGDVLVVDVGGATTDVYSVLEPRDDSPRDDVAGTLWHGRTVEGDLGVRWNAPSVVDAALRERLVTQAEADELRPPSQSRAAQPSLLPLNDDERAVDARLSALAATVAVRRHARERDLRRVRLVVGSGGVFRHQPRAALAALRSVLADHTGGWALPGDASVAVDSSYVLAPAGLLASGYGQVARTLVASLIPHAHL
jgi:uncharacterized protein (TIGR01319 family)